MSLQSGLESLEGISRLGITADAANHLRLALEQDLPAHELATAIEQCPVCMVLVLQRAASSFYRGHAPVTGLPMALGQLGLPAVQQLLRGLLLALPRRSAGHGERELGERLEQAGLRILPVCAKGNPDLLHTVLRLFRLVPLLSARGTNTASLPDWTQWGTLLLDRLGPETLPRELNRLLARLDSTPAEQEDPVLAADLALLQLVLSMAAGRGPEACDPSTWRMLELPPRLMQSLSSGEFHRG